MIRILCLTRDINPVFQDDLPFSLFNLFELVHSQLNAFMHRCFKPLKNKAHVIILTQYRKNASKKSS